MNKYLFILIFIFSYKANIAQQVVVPHSHPGIKFTENLGQWDEHVLFKAGLDGGAVFIENNKLTFNFYDKQKTKQFHFSNRKSDSYFDDIIKGHSFNLTFENCNASGDIEKLQQTSYYENFFSGQDRSKWKGNVNSYNQLYYKNLYSNIDYEILTSVNNIKYNFHVKPGANVSDIKLTYSGVNSIKLKQNELIIKTSISEIIEQKPYAYQIINGVTKEISCHYVLTDHTVSYDFPRGYDKNYELIIDPLLVFAAQSGSTADNFGMTATFDSQGNLYSGGTIFDIGYPVTIGAYSSSFFGPAYYGNTDIVITKYNATGTSLLYSTYFGGNGTESVNSLIIDHNDNLCFYGVTSSTNFPVSTNAYDISYNGGQFIMFVNNGLRFNNGTDIYVAKFSSSGNSLLASTYIGGSRNDGLNHSNANNFFNVPVPPPGTGTQVVAEPKYDSLQHNYGDQSRGEIQVDLQNNIYVASSSRSTNFPTLNSFDNTLGGKQDGVIFKFNSGLSTLLYSSYIGGSSNDACYGLVIDNNFDVFVTGGTSSNDLPFTTGGYQSTYQGGIADGFVLRIAAAGNSVLNGTYFGTSKYDQSYFIQSDKQKNIYIYGQSFGHMPVLQAVNSSTVFSVPRTHQFISRFDKTLSTLNMSTVFGHDTIGTDISPSAFSVDKCSNIYLSGWGSSLFAGSTLSNMPLLQATQSTTDGSDFYFMGLDSNAAVLKYGSYFGGNLSREHVDGGTSRFDPLGKIYQSVCAGCGGNDDFPVTPGAWPCVTPGACPPGPNFNTNCNNGVIKIDFQLLVAVSTINTNTLSGCVPVTVNFTNASPGTSYVWYLNNTDTTSIIANPSITYTTPGTYSVALVIYNPSSCNVKDSSVTYVTVYPNPVSLFTSTYSPCSNTITTTNNSTGAGVYTWNWGDSSPTSTVTAPSHTYTANGSYTVGLTVTTADGCISKTTTTLNVLNFTTAVSSGSICSGSTIPLIAQGGTSYTWQPAATISNSLIANPNFTPTSTTIYSVQIDNNSQGYLCSTTLTIQILVNPTPVSNFTLNVDSCSTLVHFVNQTLPAPTTSTWYVDYPFSGGMTQFSSQQNPTYYFGSSGTQTIQLISQSVAGCKDTVIKTIVIPVDSAFVSAPQTKCFNETGSLNAGGGNSYSWQPTTGLDNATISFPICTATASTIYTVTITQNSLYGNVCIKTLTTSITVFPKMTSSFNYTADPCGNNVQFADSSYTNPVNWQWSFGDSNSSLQQNTSHFYSSPGTYSVSLITSNSFGCSDTSKQIITLNGFVFSINSPVMQCEQDTARLIASGGDYYIWQPAQYLSNPNISNPLAFPPNTTTYTVTVGNIVGNDTCKNYLTTTVSILPLSYNTNSIAVSSNTIILGESVFVALNGFTFFGNISVYPSVPINFASSTSFSITPPKTGEYTIYFTDQNGCRHTLKTIYVVLITNECNDGVVYLPTGFTPNSDGVNDVLYIRSNFVTDVYLTIYDRWGEKLFETDDLKKGWDGTYKGKLLDQGVYGYYMTFKCNNGEESFKKGNITLTR
jgi:gliding motility-associated-like protein